MTYNKRFVSVLLTIAAMGILILDSNTALKAVAEGIDRCLKVVIPSLFPFLILSSVLTQSAFGMNMRFLHPFCRMCRISNEAAPLLLVGLIGGYPVGAQCITRAWKNGQLSAKAARRMLGFCSNAGPAFIFGMTAGLFGAPVIPWVIWLVQILSVMVAARLLSGDTKSNPCVSDHSLSPAAVLRQAIVAMASICGWVIIFQTVCVFFDKWVPDTLPHEIRCLTAGLLELTNGCCRLSAIQSQQLRFILCNVFLSFGGLGVYMQTVSVTQILGTGSYLRGKLTQTAVSAFFSSWLSVILFPHEQLNFQLHWMLQIPISMIIFRKLFQFMKNNSRKTAAIGV